MCGFKFLILLNLNIFKELNRQLELAEICCDASYLVLVSNWLSCFKTTFFPSQIHLSVMFQNGLHQQPVFGSCLCDLIQAQNESEIKSINSLDIPWILHALISQIVTRKGHLQEGILRSVMALVPSPHLYCFI